MGHVRLGQLPKTRAWKAVVGLLASKAEVDAVAAASAQAAEDDLNAAADDASFNKVCWLLAQVPLAARTPDFVGALKALGLDVGPNPTLFEISGAFSEAIDNVHRRSDFGEMAHLAAVETINSVIGSRLEGSLFSSTSDDVQRELGKLAGGKAFGDVAHEFFARLTYRHLDYFLSRELPNHVGRGLRFANVSERAAFDAALGVHCRETARIVREFAGAG